MGQHCEFHFRFPRLFVVVVVLTSLLLKRWFSYVMIWTGGGTMDRLPLRKRVPVTTTRTRTARACTSMLTCRKRSSWATRLSSRALVSRLRQSITATRHRPTSIPVKYAFTYSDQFSFSFPPLSDSGDIIESDLSADSILLSPVRAAYWRFGGASGGRGSALRSRQQVDRHLARVTQHGRHVAPSCRSPAAHQKLVRAGQRPLWLEVQQFVVFCGLLNVCVFCPFVDCQVHDPVYRQTWHSFSR